MSSRQLLEADLRVEVEIGFRRDVRRIVRRPSRYRTSFPLDEVDVEFADGTRAELILKRVALAALDHGVRRVKPGFLHDPAREAEVYRILAGAALGTPRLVAAGDGWLLLERVPGVELFQVGDLAVWQEVARWLAELHDRFADETPPSPHLLHHDAAFYRRWPRRAVRFGLRELEPIAAAYDAVVERLVSLPTTLVHGEFYPSNVLVAGNGSRVAPVDWEMAAVGPGLIDVAALTAGWPRREADTIVAAYGPVDGEALECCRLHLALQWLGWSPSWSPPSAQARDWSEDALLSAGRLGLI